MACKRTTISAETRKILNSQQFCANKIDKPAPGCRGYLCPLWNGPRLGEFDESGSEIDHIIEVTRGGTNEITNLQKLCPCCHAVKTKRCAKQRWDFNSIEIDSGAAYMEIDKKRKR
jgi:5-methylcytosine-specific restriction endonuclease McrA